MPGSAGALRLAVTTAALGLLHVVQVLTRDVASYVVPLTLAVVALALATTARLARVCCAEARLSAVLIGSYSVAAALLPVIVGLPGDGRGPLTGIRVIEVPPAELGMRIIRAVKGTAAIAV